MRLDVGPVCDPSVRATLHSAQAGSGPEVSGTGAGVEAKQGGRREWGEDGASETGKRRRALSDREGERVARGLAG